MKKRISHIYFIIIFSLLTGINIVMAQAAQNPESVKADTNVLKVYFFLLVFATIVNRILQYIKLIFQWLWLKWKFLQKIGDFIWSAVKKQLDKLNFEYDESKVRSIVNKTAVAIVLHTLGFVIGIIICVVFELGAIDDLGWDKINPTLNYIFSGILIGAGIDPIHSVFRLAGEKKKMKKLYAQAAK